MEDLRVGFGCFEERPKPNGRFGSVRVVKVWKAVVRANWWRGCLVRLEVQIFELRPEVELRHH